MRCFCCPALIPIPVCTFYDMKTDRFYCHTCQLYIEEFLMSLEDPRKIPEPILEEGEVETLEEDYYPDDFYDDYDDFYIEDDYLIDLDMEDQ